MSEMPILIIILLIVAFLLRLDFIFYVIYVSLGIYTLSYFYTPFVFKRLELNRVFHPRSFLGETLTITTLLTNKSNLPIPWIETREMIPLELKLDRGLSRVTSLRGKERKDFSYQIRGMKRGYYKIGPLQLVAGDYFGFREITKSLAPDFITIYPKIVSISDLQLPSRLPFGTLASNQRLYQDPARPIGVRDYEFGDSPRHINWKSSARVSKMLVKTYEPAISLETMILLNLNSAEYPLRYRRDTIEWAIVAASSISAHLVEKRQSLGIASNGVDPLLQQKTGEQETLNFNDSSGRLMLQSERGDGQVAVLGNSKFMPPPLRPNTGRGQLMKVLEQLARIEAAETVIFADWLASATLYLSWGVTIIALSPNANDKLMRSLHRLLQAGFNPILVIIDPYVNFRQINQSANLFGIHAYHARNAKNLSEWS